MLTVAGAEPDLSKEHSLGTQFGFHPQMQRIQVPEPTLLPCRVCTGRKVDGEPELGYESIYFKVGCG